MNLEARLKTRLFESKHQFIHRSSPISDACFNSFWDSEFCYVTDEGVLTAFDASNPSELYSTQYFINRNDFILVFFNRRVNQRMVTVAPRSTTAAATVLIRVQSSRQIHALQFFVTCGYPLPPPSLLPHI